MKFGCVTSLLLIAIACALFYEIGATYFSPPELYVVTGVGGFVLWVGISLLLGVGSAQTDAKLIRRALSNSRPSDDQLYAALGQIYPIKDELTSPASATPCIAYSYQVLKEYSSSKSRGLVYSGLALTPSVIRTAFGEVRLLGFPMLDKFGAVFSDSAARSRMEQYIAQTAFTKVEGLDLASAFRQVKEVLTDSDGELRKDVMLSEPEALDGYVISEAVVPTGASVCVIGKYSQRAGGLVPDLNKTALRIFRGDPNEVLGQVRTSAIPQIFFGLLMTALGCGALYAMYFKLIPVVIR